MIILLEAIGKAIITLIVLIVVVILAFTAYILPPFLVGRVIIPYLESTTMDGQMVFVLSILSLPLMYGFMILTVVFVIVGILRDRTKD